MLVFMLDGDDIEIFRSQEEAEKFIEPYDAEDPNLIFCTLDGGVFHAAVVDDRTKLTLPEAGQRRNVGSHFEDVLRSYVAALGIALGGRGLSREELVQRILRYEQSHPDRR